MKETVEATQTSESTIKRRRLAGQINGAKQSDGSDGQQPGTWLFPVDGLLAAGFRLNSPTVADPVSDLDQDPVMTGLTGMQRDLLNARHRAELAEGILRERDRLIVEMERTNESLRLSLRALTAGPPTDDRYRGVTDSPHLGLDGQPEGSQPVAPAADLRERDGQQPVTTPPQPALDDQSPVAGRRGWFARTFRGGSPS